MTPEIIYEKPIKGLTETKKYNKELEKYEMQQTEQAMLKKELMFNKSFNDPFSDISSENIKIPSIIYVSNKSENGREGDIMAEAWKLGIDEPIFISAVHGDGLPDLYKAIQENIPQQVYENFEHRKQLRLSRYNEYKDMLLTELEELKSTDLENAETLEYDYSFSELSNEFDRLNPDPEYNSDFDSDNEIIPLDTITKIGYSSSISGISSENLMKKKPIQLSVIGRPNVGKSTIVNSFLRENRVIANDMPGTTRDAITIQWVHRGRRVNLVDTAGIKIKQKNKDRIEEMVDRNVKGILNYSHVVLVLIDAMESFTHQDMAIMSKVIEEGRALVVAANKWDIVADKYKRKAVLWMHKQLEK